MMVKNISIILIVAILLSACPMAFAAEVIYNATGMEEYAIAVPASLSPGENGTVTLSGTWADNRVAIVTADPTATFVSYSTNDKKVLNIDFNGMREVGSNTGSQIFTEETFVEAIQIAPFGGWIGQFDYSISFEDVSTMLDANHS